MRECCFCSVSMDEGGPQVLSLLVEAAGRVHEVDHRTQTMWCHAACLSNRLAPSVPFDLDVFDD
jgi:hypothetical protein